LAHVRFNWLYQDPSIFHRYFTTPDHYTVYGLPTSPVEDLGQYYAVRFQRAVMYHWKSNVPWADPRGVSVGLGGDLFKELGLLPADAIHPQPTVKDDYVSEPLPAITTPAKVPMVVPKYSPPAAITAAQTGLPILVGVATWYGGDFQGSPMYNGQAYNMYDSTTTAANLYPIGTWLRITRLSTGRSVIVQVRDRGAFRYPDICDLSYAAFSQLADPATGVIGVRVEPVSGPDG
ncbi:MAG TPA: septal ring lytic transglycosylase RlpA family protein, partial [Chloroflexota bacterium]|nr:septal ring lytic transglycosylase RlpA family protein [Chloroflexota bacterium]